MAPNKRAPALAAFAALAMLMAGTVPYAHAADLQANPSNYRAMLRGLKPGDRLTLEAGVYRDGLPLHNLKGSAEQPIRIAAAKGAAVEFVGRAGHNTVSLSNTAHVQISGLAINGDNLAVGAVKAEGHKACVSVHHIVLEDLLIVGHGVDQQIVGISSFCPAWNWIIRRNLIVGAGTGLYLGNSDGSAPFVGGVIEQNVLIDARGYNMQIKHQIERPADSGMPKEPARTLIRHNVFAKVHNASAGPAARPSLLLGHFPRQGAGSDDVYEVSHNLFFCSPREALLQAEGNVAMAGNIFVNPEGDAISVQPHNDIPKTIDIKDNFIAASGRGVSIVDKESGYAQTVSGNAIYASPAATGGKQAGNQIAAFQNSVAALSRWLTAQHGGALRAGEYASLVDMSQRLCATRANGHQKDQPWVADNLRHHPVCQLVQQIAAAAGRPAAPVAATVVNESEAAQCLWK